MLKKYLSNFFFCFWELGYEGINSLHGSGGGGSGGEAFFSG
jgi:hypothetical protein